MKNSVYTNKGLLAIILFPCITFIGGLMLFIFQEFIPAIVAFGMTFLIGLCEFFARKLLFSRIKIDEQGVVIFYKNKTLKKIKWNEIKDAMVNPYMFGGGIMISNEKYDDNAKPGKEFIKKNNHGIILNLSIKYIFAMLCKYFNKIPVPVKKFSQLPLKTQKMLINFK